MRKDVNHDRAVIDRLGGPTAVARLLRWYPGGVQRVSNWRTRGIPAEVRLTWPDLFPMPDSAGFREPVAQEATA